MSPAPSIPTSPRPGKDPPATTADETKAGQTESSENTINMNDTGEVRNIEEKEESKEDKDRESMPPPPSKNRPTIITQAPSTPNILSASSRIQQASHLSAPHDPSLSQDQVLPQQPANFQGFFILVDDLKTKSTAHPHKIHYLFSDDDTSDLLTTSLLDNIPISGDLHTSLDEEEEEDTRSDHSSSSSSTFKSPNQNSRASTKKTKETPPTTQTKEERTIIIDISPTGDSITAVNSLTPNWQVMHAAIENAPNLDQDKGSEEGKGGGGLMLKVEGIGGDAINGDYERGLGMGRDGERGMGEDEMRELMEGFDRKMGMLRKIVEGGKVKGEDASVS